MIGTQVLVVFVAVFNEVFSYGGTPFEEVEKYINHFERGIADLKHHAKKYARPEEIQEYDADKFNETEAMAEAKEFDFIIVGGGASGSALANRLSEVPEWKILLLEAGGEEDEITTIPANTHHLLLSKYNYGYKTTPQKSWCLSSVDHRCPIESGKALGGSTTINGMVYTRGNRKDYDKWADQGNKDWCYDSILPYFKKIEDAHLKYFDRKLHYMGGPMHLENSQYKEPLTPYVLSAAKELHYPFVDHNGKEQMGIGFAQGTTKHGTRWSAARGYLKEAGERENMVIKPYSKVVKIMISPHTKEAYGVQYLHDGELCAAKAKKEVILSAGSLNTPQLLLLSGIGPKETLEKHEIEPISILPVGQNLKDHPGFSGVKIIFNRTLAYKPNERENLIEYLKSGKGPLSKLFMDVLAFVKTEKSKEKGPYPDIEMAFVPYVHKPKYDLNQLSHNDDHEVIGQEAMRIAVILVQPKSTGSVSIECKDPLKAPLIDLNLLSDEDDHDIDTMLSGIRLAQKFARTASFQKLGAYLDAECAPECDDQHEYDTDEFWMCAIRHQARSLRHVMGTARMGPEGDKNSVVDSKLSVHGVSKLRVVDASVIPVSITGHTMAAAYLIGEKGADIIKEYWG